MSTAIVLSDDHERFARACVESGPYGSIDEVVGASLRRLKSAEDQRTSLIILLQEAEADRDGDVSLDDALDAMDAALASHERGPQPSFRRPRSVT
jgi:antitoxin ParD1/3/4